MSCTYRTNIVYIHLYTTYIYTKIVYKYRVCIHMYTHMHIYAYMHWYAYMHCLGNPYVHVYTYIHVHNVRCVFMCTYVYTRYAYTYIVDRACLYTYVCSVHTAHISCIYICTLHRYIQISCMYTYVYARHVYMHCLLYTKYVYNEICL